MLRGCFLAGVLLVFSPSSSALAEQPRGFRVGLFNGEDLQGWHPVGCNVVVEEGRLVLCEGNGILRTDHQYGDFVLEFHSRSNGTGAGDSGVFFRCDPPGNDAARPDRYEVDLRTGHEGNLVGSVDVGWTGTVDAKEWNRYRLTAIGTTAKLEINGIVAWQTDAMEARYGYVALQAAPSPGGRFEFKEIYVTELGYRPLFNGTDLSGWEGAGKDATLCWAVEDGLLMCNGKKGPWLRSLEQFGDFNLRLEYRLKPGGNSGVYVRVPKDGDHHGEGAGVEIQVLDDNADRYRNLKPYQYTGSVYAIAAAQVRSGRAAGQWNALEIDGCGSHYEVTHNGVVIVDADATRFPELARRRAEGFLGLQNHSEEVFYRNLRIGPPRPAPASRPPEAAESP